MRLFELPALYDPMKEYPNWVVVEHVPIEFDDQGNPTEFRKIHLDPKKIRSEYSSWASVNNPKSWGTYEQALTALGDHDTQVLGTYDNNKHFEEYKHLHIDDYLKKHGARHSLAFCLTNTPFAAIDLDHVCDLETGFWSSDATRIVGKLQSLTEYSPGGDGLHIFCRSKEQNLPATIKNPDGTEYEMYFSGKFITLTGSVFSNYPIEERSEGMAEVSAMFWSRTDESLQTEKQKSEHIDPANLEPNIQAVLDHVPVAECSREEWIRIGMFLKSAGMDISVWDEWSKDDERYKPDEITYSWNKFSDDFDGKGLRYLSDLGKAHGYQDLEIEARLQDCISIREANAVVAVRNCQAAARIPAFLNEIAENMKSGDVPTGFDRLDYFLDGGLHSGRLYAVGAISSLGKSSFVLQIADHIASSGKPVLFVALEMSASELVAKSVSRQSYVKAIEQRGNTDWAKTTQNILSGYFMRRPEAERNFIMDRISEYEATTGKSLFVLEGVGDISADTVQSYMDGFKTLYGEYPVLVVDYLQILAPEDPRMSDKQNIDKAVVTLKRIARDYNVPVIVICSFNRENYSKTASFAAFKESGAIEYTSDVVMALQLAGMPDDNKNNEFDVEAAKAEEIRKLELKILKNRAGRLPNKNRGEKLLYNFLAKFNMFAEVD